MNMESLIVDQRPSLSPPSRVPRAPQMPNSDAPDIRGIGEVMPDETVLILLLTNETLPSSRAALTPIMWLLVAVMAEAPPSLPVVEEQLGLLGGMIVWKEL